MAGRLTFWFTSVAPGGNGGRVSFAGTVQKDGALAGTLNCGQSSVMPWTALRDKE